MVKPTERPLRPGDHIVDQINPHVERVLTDYLHVLETLANDQRLDMEDIQNLALQVVLIGYGREERSDGVQRVLPDDAGRG